MNVSFRCCFHWCKVFLIVFLPIICFREVFLRKAITYFVLPNIFLGTTDVGYVPVFVYNFLSN